LTLSEFIAVVVGVLLSCVVAPWISLILHEGGHALAGRAVGLQIREIRLGQGRPAMRWRIGDIDFHLAPLPLCGWIIPCAPLHYSRWRMMPFIAGGPAADILWLAALVAVFLAYQDYEIAGYLLSTAIAYQLWRVVKNCVPRTAKIYGTPVASDMLALWRTLGKKGDVNAAYRQTYIGLLSRYMEPGETVRRFESRSDRIAFLLKDLEVRLRRLTEERLAALERELARRPLRCEQLLIIETIAAHLLAGEGLRDLAYLDRLTAQAVELAPDLPTLKGTRGAALAFAGRHEEALAMLAQADDSNDFNRCLNAAFQALAHFHAGRPGEARASFETAEGIVQSNDWAGWIGCRIVERVGAEIGDQAPMPAAATAG
jgi:tetratricopeptide (TPR) repeat protein